jgi:hypothetical protein
MIFALLYIKEEKKKVICVIREYELILVMRNKIIYALHIVRSTFQRKELLN